MNSSTSFSVALSEIVEVDIGEGTLARKFPYSVAESWSFKSSESAILIALLTQGFALRQVEIVLRVKETDTETTDQAFEVAVLSIEVKHRNFYVARYRFFSTWLTT